MITQRHHEGMALAGSLALMIAGLAGHASTAVAAQATEFFCSGSDAWFTVPAGVTQLWVSAHGAQGQTRGGSAPGGFGGTVTATVPVKPGDVLKILVGCEGNHSGNFGWGVGGDHGIAHAGEAEDGGFGGGGSAVVGPDQTVLVVAGGGGGDGGDGAAGGFGGQGGPGGNGGIKPQPGGQGCTSVGCPNVGGSPGGGKGGCAACAIGTFGGRGTDSSTLDGGGGGGGGGGGHVGGGGGHGGSGFVLGDGGGGGGGGSSHVISSAINVSHGIDTRGGDGYVILSWSVGPNDQPIPGPIIADDASATGCLGRGQLRALDLGQDPLRPCGRHEIQITIAVTESDEAAQSSPQP